MVRSLIDNPVAFGSKLVELAHQIRPDGTTRVRKFLDDLADYAREDLPRNQIHHILRALCDVGDHLLRPEDQPRGMFDFGNDMRVSRVTWQLLSRMEASERFRCLLTCIEAGSSLSIIVQEIADLGTEHGKYSGQQPKPLEERLVSPELLVQLERAVCSKIERAAHDGKLLETPLLPLVLYRWRDWGGNDRVREWIHKIFLDDTNVLIFLEKFLGRSFSIGLGDSIAKMKLKLDRDLGSLIISSDIYDRIRKLPPGLTLSQNQQLAVAQFITNYELQQRGKDPADFE